MVSKLEAVSKALDVVFKESSDFIVIGLTGRTGSGCSTSAKLLAMDRLPLPDIGNSHFKGNEARKYRVVKDYIDERWTPFKWLQIRTVITRYLLSLSFSEFTSLVSNILNEDLSLIQRRVSYFKADYNNFHDKVVKYIEMEDDSIESKNDKKKLSYCLYFEELPDFSDVLRECLRKISYGAYTQVYQAVGDNIRSSGKANDSNFNASKVFSFSRVISKVVNSARYVSNLKSEACYVVIDAIRNPYEAIFLKDRYADFFLLSVNTNNENRLKHLRSSRKFTDEQIRKLDDKEYPKKLVGDKKFTSQNIQKCIEISDIHINNPKDEKYGTSELASQLAWYISLMMHPGLIMPTSVESCMQIAYSVKKNSGCISRQVGAVVADEFYSLKAVGWNNTPRGQVPCLLRNVEHLINGIDSLAYSNYEKNDDVFRIVLNEKFTKEIIDKSKLSGRNLSFCFKDLQNEVEKEKNQVHTRSLHAEENAFLQISKYGGQALKGGILFTTASPCELCAKKAYQLGISKIIYIDPYPGIATSHILSAGDDSPDLILFRGAVGTSFHKLYQPIMPYKDELEMYLNFPKKIDSKQLTIKRLELENQKLKERINVLESRQSELL